MSDGSRRPVGFKIADEADVRIVTIEEPQIDHEAETSFKEILEREVFTSATGVILQLDGVEYLSSMALGLISLAAVMTANRGVGFVVVCSREAVLKLFVISGLYKAVKISNSTESARLKLQPAPGTPSV